jgi:hypothetical protein
MTGQKGKGKGNGKGKGKGNGKGNSKGKGKGNSKGKGNGKGNGDSGWVWVGGLGAYGGWLSFRIAVRPSGMCSGQDGGAGWLSRMSDPSGGQPRPDTLFFRIPFGF